MRTAIGLVLLLTTLNLGANTGPTTHLFTSGDTPVTLVELYTSEGCSSCPPADRYLSGLESSPGLWRDFVPVALHVDYWDDIGWPDRFASRDFSDRQRRYAREGGTRVVYTPGLFRNGQEWRGWRLGGPGNSQGPAVGALSIESDGETFSARFEPAEGVAADTLHIAILGMDLATEVKAGENRGRRLEHDFVLLGLRSVPLESGAEGLEATGALPGARVDAQRTAIAAWVTASGRQAPIQSVGGFLDAD
ncbi:MAG: DUF1223 domain-containing protein [Pseudomonadota bacterium]